MLTVQRVRIVWPNWPNWPWPTLVMTWGDNVFAWDMDLLAWHTEPTE